MEGLDVRMVSPQQNKRFAIVALSQLHRFSPLLHAILLEFYSLFGRIEILRKNNLYRCGISLGPTWERNPTGQLQRCIRTRDRMRRMQRLLSIHPKASPVDLYLLLNTTDVLQSCRGEEQYLPGKTYI